MLLRTSSEATGQEAVHKQLQTNVDALLSQAPIPIALTNPAKGARAVNFYNIFNLVIPYCQSSLAWTVILDPLKPSNPPDFIFPPGEEAWVRISQLSTLSKWNPLEDPESLLRVILELLGLYQQRQRQLIKSCQERIVFEFETIQEWKGLEVMVKSPGMSGGEVWFLFPLSLSEETRNQIQQLSIWEEWESEKSHQLLVQFPNTSYQQPPDSRILLTKHWARCLGDVAAPAWTEDTCLMMFVPTVVETIEAHINAALLRRSLLVSLRQVFGSPLEYDSTRFLSISFAADIEEFIFVLHFDIPLGFPKDKPVFTAQSMQHHKAGPAPLLALFGEACDSLQVKISYSDERSMVDYPYSPRWSPQELSQRIKDFLTEKVPEIKKKWDKVPRNTSRYAQCTWLIMGFFRVRIGLVDQILTP